MHIKEIAWNYLKNKIETIEELLSIKELNNSKLDELVDNREYMWIKYHRAKIESKKIETYNDISKITEKIKEIDKEIIRDNEKDIVR